MKTEELEQVIREYIRDIYKREYTDRIIILPLDVGYNIKMEFGVRDKPLVICALLEDEPFLKFLKEELRKKLLHLVDYGELNLVYPARSLKEAMTCRRKN